MAGFWRFSVFLVFTLFVLAPQAQGTVVGNCNTDRCYCANNFNTYAADYGTPPDSCDTSLPWKCFCNSTGWRIGRWKILFPLKYSPSGPYYSSYNSKYPNQPWLAASATRDNCCKLCSNYNVGRNVTQGPYCNYWQHFVPPTSQPTCSKNATTITSSSADCGYCLIFGPGASPSCETESCSYGVTTGINANMSTVGKGCVEGKNDPHFVGAHGTQFDFNGVPDQSFCLITDPAFQVNMKMIGYYDHRTVGASLLKNGMAVRTWIKELGVLWIDPQTGTRHAFKITARSGKSQTRDDGFVGGIQADGEDLPRMKVGDSITADGGLLLRFVGYEKQGGGFFDVDMYELQVLDLLHVEIKLRIAHPLLQTRSEAMTHINVRFFHVSHSESTHGVLGQTFLEGREKRAFDYTALSLLMGRNVAADGEAGTGFLDGTTTDYRTSSVLSSDCKFSAFDGQQLPAGTVALSGL